MSPTNPGTALALDWSEFDRCFLPANLAAAVIVDQLLSGAEPPEPSELADDTASQVNLRLRQRALDHDPMTPAAASYAAKVAEVVVQSGGGIDTPEEEEVTAAIVEVNAILGDAIRAENQGEPEEAIRHLTHATERLAAIGRPASRRKLVDVEDYKALIEAARGRACIAAGRHDEGEQAFWSVVELRDRSTETGGRLFTDLIAYVDRFGARNPDRALTRLIPLVRHRLSSLAADEKVVLLMTLADLYRGIGDIEAARRLLQDSDGILAEANLCPPEAGEPQALLDNLVAASTTGSDGRAPTETERHARFAALLTALMKRANILRQAPGDGGPVHLAAIGWMSQLAAEAMARSSASAAKPDADMERAGQVIAEMGLAPSTSGAMPLKPLDLNGSRRYGALDSRAETEGPSESLAAAFEALAGAAALQPTLAAQALSQAAGMRADLGDTARAEAGYLLAADRARLAEDLWQEIQAVMGLVVLPDEVRSQALKRADLRGLIERIEQRRARLNAAYLPSAFMSDKVMAYAVAAHLAGKAGDHAERLSLLERLRAFEIHGPPLSGPATDALRRQVVELSDRLRAETDPELAARIRIDRRLAWDELMIARPRTRPDFDLAALQSRLGGAVALSAFYLAPDVLDITLISAQEVIQVRRRLAEVPDYAALVASVVQPSRLDLHFSKHLAQLARLLLPEEIRPALEQATEIAVAPHRDLHGLPWGALPLGGEPLIHGRPLATVPNLTVLTRPSRPGPGPRPFFGIGTRETAATDGSGRRFIDLPNAEAEVAAAANHFPQASTMLGEAATRAVFLADQRLPEAGTLLVALHGTDVADPSLARAPMETTLAFHDGPIDGVDIACLPLSARLVVTTACYSGRRAARLEGMEALPADALYGLQAAFLLAGAEAVIAALWKAGDLPARRIADELFKALSRDASPAEALHLAIRTYLDTPGLRRFERDVYAWAPYVLTAFSPAAFTFGNTGEQ